MTLTDAKLIQFLVDDSTAVRTAAMELLSGSCSTDQRWLPAVFAAWDRFGPAEAFPEFPLLSHIAIPAEFVGESIARAEDMVTGRAITDRVCRCAGKLIEAISVSAPTIFADHLDALSRLKQKSKIFFRINEQHMRARCKWIVPVEGDLTSLLEDESLVDRDLYGVLEGQFLQGSLDPVLKNAFDALLQSDWNIASRTLAETCLGLASRYRMIGFESYLIELIDHPESSIADVAAIGLARCRTATVLSIVASQFSHLTKSGQLRAIDILRRGRLPKTVELLRFLQGAHPGADAFSALKLAEILQFDFSELEDWLEAVLTLDDQTFARFKSQLAVAIPLAQELEPSDRDRTVKLLNSRLG
jgi:hypothetical protein